MSYRRFLTGIAGPVVALMLTGVCSQANAETVALRTSGAGTLYVQGGTADGATEFLLDTGAGISTVSREQLEQLTGSRHSKPIREIGARLANGRIELMQVYEIPHFSIGNCDLGTIEVAVARRGGRNLLGLSALRSAGPFSVAFSPATLTLERCAEQDGIASAY